MPRKGAGCGNGARVEPVRHRQTKGAATDMFGLQPLRHTSTLPPPRPMLCSPIHNRMPVILDPAGFPAWLGETSTAPEQLQALLRPFPAERMEAHMIGPAR